MARTRRLDEMRSDIRIAADIVSQTTRHPDAQLTRWINESIQRVRELVALNGLNHYSTSDEASVASGDPTVTITSPTGEVARVTAMDVLVDGRWRDVWPASTTERNDYGGVDGPAAIRGIPARYLISGDGLFVMPVPDGAYDLRVHYVPSLVDLVAAGDTFDGVVGWEDWVLNDVCCKVAKRDEKTELYKLASTERANIEMSIIKMAPKRQTQQAGRRMNTRTRRRWSGRRGETWF